MSLRYALEKPLQLIGVSYNKLKLNIYILVSVLHTFRVHKSDSSVTKYLSSL